MAFFGIDFTPDEVNLIQNINNETVTILGGEVTQEVYEEAMAEIFRDIFEKAGGNA